MVEDKDKKERHMKRLPAPEWWLVRRKILKVLEPPQDFFEDSEHPAERYIRVCANRHRRTCEELVREILWRKFGVEVDVKAKELI
jgi:hypothetical protein